MAVLDTNIVSYAFRGDSRAALYQPWLEQDPPLISFFTLAELYKWSLERGLGPRRSAALEKFIRGLVVLPVDDLLARRWARLVVERKITGRPMELADAWIAATALRHGLPLVTHNRRHFAGIDGLEVISFAPE